MIKVKHDNPTALGPPNGQCATASFGAGSDFVQVCAAPPVPAQPRSMVENVAAPPLHFLGVSIGMWRGRRQNDGLADGYSPLFVLHRFFHVAPSHSTLPWGLRLHVTVPVASSHNVVPPQAAIMDPVAQVPPLKYQPSLETPMLVHLYTPRFKRGVQVVP